MINLGLDISTATVGYTFIEGDKILDMGFIDIKKQTTHKEKAFFALKQLEDNIYISNIKRVYVEDNLSGFMSGRTSQQTIIKLAKFNAILCFLLEDRFNVEIKSINPMTARKQVFGKARIKGKKAKVFVKEQIERLYDTDNWCKYTIRGNWDKRNIDMYDSLVMALYGDSQNEF